MAPCIRKHNAECSFTHTYELHIKHCSKRSDAASSAVTCLTKKSRKATGSTRRRVWALCEVLTCSQANRYQKHAPDCNSCRSLSTCSNARCNSLPAPSGSASVLGCCNCCCDAADGSAELEEPATGGAPAFVASAAGDGAIASGPSDASSPASSAERFTAAYQGCDRGKVTCEQQSRTAKCLAA